MLMMLASWAFCGARAWQFMLMMLAAWLPVGWKAAADAHDAGLLGLWWGKGPAVHAHDARHLASRGLESSG